MRATLQRTKAFFEHHERVLSAGALFLGFIVDSLTLRSIDLLAENIALLAYLLLVGASIFILAIRDSRSSSGRIFGWLVAVAPFVMQLAFGALFSAFVVFYSRSASLSASWPFIGFLVGMLIGNEVFRERYERFVFHVGVFFIALLSYSILLVPVLLRSIGVGEFLASIAGGIFLMALFLSGLMSVAPARVKEAWSSIAQVIGLIIAITLFTYATNIIPPVPLVLKDSAVAHSVVRTGDSYEVSVEPNTFLNILRFKETVHRSASEPVYVWTSVFAPTHLNTGIVHEWQYREERSWVTMSRVMFPIEGGRARGFRGYSTKTNLVPGAWRVSVETQGGQVIGRVRFDVVPAAVPPELTATTR